VDSAEEIIKKNL